MPAAANGAPAAGGIAGGCAKAAMPLIAPLALPPPDDDRRCAAAAAANDS